MVGLRPRAPYVILSKFRWVATIFLTVRWDPARTNDLFFDQSAALYCNYYLTRILIHRPFIPAIRPLEGPMVNTHHIPLNSINLSCQTFLSLTICNNAARACIHVVEAQHRRRPNNPLLFGQVAVTLFVISPELTLVSRLRSSRRESFFCSTFGVPTVVVVYKMQTCPMCAVVWTCCACTLATGPQRALFCMIPVHVTIEFTKYLFSKEYT
jgi:hypothetical protein